ncbi:unnamed protein product [Rotaria sp. Silwood2]|nr:unnamed protein product [Rotaria sp. Silwood2]CAF3185127.1 unnamed protein product [Rotaria sp. Silwood2]CAF3384316.1 unnamed protein product [Rotaria sp. Silwood2]CAF3476581.1 unnamed protein product [Rotaria sp. Silwood2]CAF3941843.1 unnamed protein product [Rotaria sp. Silwood2]
MVILSSSRLLQEKENKLKYKLWDLGVRKEYIEVNDPGVVTNLSSRVLSDEEIQCLANGLDDGLIPKRIDRLNIASNVEQFYHRVTDITQHHKEFMNELKEHGGIVNTDVRVLNPKELTLVSDLRSLTQSFLHKADQFRQQNLKIESKEQNYRTILKNLREDNSIVITRPDKGRGIVLMDRQERQLHIKNSSPTAVVPELNNGIVVLRVPYFGTESRVYGKRVTSAVAKQHPLKKVRVIYDIADRIGKGFKLKDYLTDELKSGIVYEATCSQCNKSYVGQTFRHLKTRVHEHILDQKKFLPQTVIMSAQKKKYYSKTNNSP